MSLKIMIMTILAIVPILALFGMIGHDIWKGRGGKFFADENEFDSDEDYHI